MAQETLSREGYEEAFINLLSSPKYIDLSFYSFIIAKMEVSFSRMIPTAGAGFSNNNYQLIINPDFFNQLPLDQRIGILVHETLHVILKHIFRKGERDHVLFNVAADMALNQSIKRDMLPEGAIYPDTFKFKENLTAEQYYELLKEEQKKQQQEKEEFEKNNPGSKQEDCDNCGGTGKQEKKEPADKGEGEDGDSGEDGEEHRNGTEPCDCCSGTGKQPNDKAWPGPSNGNPDITGKKELTIDSHEAWDSITQEEEELASQMMEKMIENAIEKTKGNTPGNLEHIMDLWKRAPKISWKKVLKRFVSSKVGAKEGTIKRRDRRQPNRNELKGKKTSYDVPNIIVGLDTSGSMSDEEIVNGLIEINEVCKVTNSTLQIVQIDTKIQGAEEFDPKKKTFKRRGCGGTYMGAMAKFLTDEKIKYDALVMISDMEIEDVSTDKNWGKLKKPTLWLNTSGIKVSWEGTKGHTIMDIAKA